MSNVPMTRPEEAFAIHDIHHHFFSAFVELYGGRILQLPGKTFITSDDGGIT